MKAFRVVIGNDRVKVLVVDAENDFTHPKGSFGRISRTNPEKYGIERIIHTFDTGLVPLVEKARGYGVPVGFVRAEYSVCQFPDFPDKYLSAIPPLTDRFESVVINPDTGGSDQEWRVKIYKDLPKEGEPTFRKDTYKPFHFKGEQNGLGEWLDITKYVIVCGFTTDNCVNGAVTSLREAGYVPIVPEDCTDVRNYKMSVREAKFVEWAADPGIVVVPTYRDIEFVAKINQ